MLLTYFNSKEHNPVTGETQYVALSPEFFSTHPNPDNRVGNIEQATRERFPQGVPEGMRE